MSYQNPIYGVFIGRFQPFHNGHAEVIRYAMKHCDHLIIVVGSANRHRSIKNPFSFYDRKKMIEDWFVLDQEPLVQEFLTVVPSHDNLYKDWTWKAGIVSRVSEVVPEGAKVKLFGHFKDESSYYLNLFPEWELQEVGNYMNIDATSLRQSLFESGVHTKMTVPLNVYTYLRNFKAKPEYQDLVEEWKFYEQEKVKFFDYPYPETLGFMCSDALVSCMGHILVVKRKHAPGKNTWALPGGFKERNETFKEACIRELREETNLRVPPKVIEGSIVASNMFDNPRRTIGIPRVSMTYHIELKPDSDGKLPKARPASDALEVSWMPLSDLLADSALFDDHLDIIKYFM